MVVVDYQLISRWTKDFMINELFWSFFLKQRCQTFCASSLSYQCNNLQILYQCQLNVFEFQTVVTKQHLKTLGNCD